MPDPAYQRAVGACLRFKNEPFSHGVGAQLLTYPLLTRMTCG